MNMHSWVGTDKVLRSEFVDNFTEIDKKFHPTTGHKHNGLAGQAPKIDAADVKLSVGSSPANNAKDALDWLFQSANNILSNIAGVIGNSYNPSSDVGMHNISAQNNNLNLWRQSFITSVRNKYGAANDTDTLSDLPTRIANIPYQLAPTGTAVVGDVSAGKTFVNSTGNLLTGTLVTRADTQILPGTADKTITAGLYKDYKIPGEANLVPNNIKKGTTLFGVTGTFEWPWGVNSIVEARYLAPQYTFGPHRWSQTNFSSTDTNNVICFDSQYNVVYATKAMTGFYIRTTDRVTGAVLKEFAVNIGTPIIDIACSKTQIIITTGVNITAIDINDGSVKWTYNKSASTIPQATLGDFIGAKTDADGNVYVFSQFGSVIKLSNTGAALVQRQYNDSNRPFIGPFQNSMYDEIYYVDVQHCIVYLLNTSTVQRSVKWNKGTTVNNHAQYLISVGSFLWLVYTTAPTSGHTYIVRCASGSAGMGIMLNDWWGGSDACYVPGTSSILFASSNGTILRGFNTNDNSHTANITVPTGRKRFIADSEGNLYMSANTIKACYPVNLSSYIVRNN